MGSRTTRVARPTLVGKERKCAKRFACLHFLFGIQKPEPESTQNALRYQVLRCEPIAFDCAALQLHNREMIRQLATAPELLVMDDDPLARETLRLILSPRYQVHLANQPSEAENILQHQSIALAVLDIRITGSADLAWLNDWPKKFPRLEFLLCTGETRIRTAMECVRLGASDYLLKPIQAEELLGVVERLLEKERNQETMVEQDTIVGNSAPIQELMRQIRQLKNQDQLNILILGESGTGKELVARLLHNQEEQRERPFIVANMPAIPTTLLESELFGFEKGTFTDAKVSKPGKFELADGGDIFLDEIGDMPVEIQAKILRILQDKKVERLGSHRPRLLQFRVISATHQPISPLIVKGSFREDLVFRLSDVVLRIPPLRERREDIPLLVEHFVRKHAKRSPAPKISDALLSRFLSHPWPGNVRQLESTIKRALVFCRDAVLNDSEIYDLVFWNPVETPSLASNDYHSRLVDFERRLFSDAIAKHAGDRMAAMKTLGMSRATFYRKIQQLGL